MDILRINGVKVRGVVGCLPENIVDNRVACQALFPGDALNTVIKATGIHKRCVAEHGTSALDLGILAAENLLENTGTAPGEIGAVICVTFTPEHLMPADAPKAQARLGMSNNSMAFDINMACSGYGYGLYIASVLVKTLNKKVLLLDGDIQSAYTSPMDKATVPVMADAGTATLLEPHANSDEWLFSFYTDGSRSHKLFIPAGGSKCPVSLEALEYNDYEDGSRRRETDIYMDGFEIFKFVAQDVSKFIKQFMEEIGLGPEQIDAFVPHQANIYMVNQLGKKLKFSPEKIWTSGEDYGNPSSASVPLTIAKNARDWFLAGKGGDIILSGFGGGLSASVAKIRLNADSYYDVIQKRKG